MEPRTINDWLKANNLSLGWLAKQCNVSETTVKGWLYGKRTINGAAVALITRLMNEPKNQEPVMPEFSYDDWERIEQHAKALGMTGREWIKMVLKAEISKPVPLTVNRGEATPIVKAAHLFRHTTPVSSTKVADQLVSGTDSKVKSKKVTYRSGRKKKA